MATTNNPLLIGLRGSIGKQIVFKNYGHCTVVTKYPDMSRVIRTPLQKGKNRIFARAVRYAQSILQDPEKLQNYKSTLKPGERVYNAAIREYMNLNKEIIADGTKAKDERRKCLINTKDERRKCLINTKDERRKCLINTKDERRRMKHLFERDAHSPPFNTLNISYVLWSNQSESITMNIHDLDG
jgi:hypothetical protein